MTEPLNDSQRRSVITTLNAFEKVLREAAAWLDSPSQTGKGLTQEQRQAGRLRIAAALEQVSALTQRLELDPEPDDPAGMIRGKLMLSWASLVDTQSGKLKRYGAVDPRLEALLDPAMQSLADLALQIESIFEG